MEDHGELFFSMWYGVYHWETKELNYVCAGHPLPLIISGESPVPFSSRQNIPLGWRTGHKYVEESLTMQAGSRMYLFSDGAYEIEKQDDKMMSLDDFYQMLAVEDKTSPCDLDQLIIKLQQIQGKEDFIDDLSLIRVEFL